MRVSIPSSFLEIFRKLEGKRTVILANHPDGQDPYVLFELSRFIRENFYYLAARDVFGVESPLHSWYGQNVGCYSIDRSETDIKAIKSTISLLEQNTRKLVIFPEGDLSGKDYDLNPFSEGMVHLLLEAQQRVAPAPLFILPIGIHYKLLEKRAVNSALGNVEQYPLQMAHTSMTPHDRLNRLIGMMLMFLDREVHYDAPPSSSLSKMVLAAGAAIVTQIATQAGVENGNAQPLNLLYKLRASHVREPISGRLMRDRLEDLQRAERLLLMARLLELEYTQENMYRILQCLAPELTGRELAKSQKLASLSAGLVVQMQDFHDQYEEDKDAAIRQASQVITRALTQAVRSPASAGVSR